MADKSQVSLKIGSKYHNWSHCGNGSLASRKIGKVLVDCRFRFSESHWGLLNNRPGGILYIDLLFTQPEHFMLASTSVRITLQTKDPDSEDPLTMPNLRQREKRSSRIDPLRREEDHDDEDACLCMHEKFGPQKLVGKATEWNKTNTWSAIPEVGAGGFSVGGMGFSSDETKAYASQWSIQGQIQTGMGPKGRRTPTYRTIVWDITENENIRAQLQRSNTVHTALSLLHDAKPFYIIVEIEGKLRKKRHRVKYMFPQKENKDQGQAVTLVNLDSKLQHSQTDLSNLAKNLNTVMVQRNLQAVPIELPNSQWVPAQHPYEDLDADDASTLCNATMEADPTQDILSSAVDRFSASPHGPSSSGSRVRPSLSSTLSTSSSASSASSVTVVPDPRELKETATVPASTAVSSGVQMPLADKGKTLDDIIIPDTANDEDQMRQLLAIPLALPILRTLAVLFTFFSRLPTPALASAPASAPAPASASAVQPPTPRQKQARVRLQTQKLS